MSTIRRSWYGLDELSKKRVLAALDRMLRDGSFFSIAKFHGWPDNQERRADGSAEFGYCEHATERFGGWHRVFLSQFEARLKKADKANGNDGTIALPYWDWIQNPTVPRELLQWREFPTSGIPQRYRNLAGLDQQKRSRFTTPSGGISLAVTRNRVNNKTNEVRNMWRLVNFPQFISKSGPNNGGFRDLEQIHDSIHGEVGGIMGDLDLAAFSPLFWLHHCQIDRLFQTYLELNGDSESEVSRDAVSRPLAPWNTRVGSTFELRGFRYDKLAHNLVPLELRRNKNTQRSGMFQELTLNDTMPSAATDVTEPKKFKPATTIKITLDQKRVNLHSYNVYAFALPIGLRGFVPHGPPSGWDQNKYFVGRCTILHGRDIRFCSNCQGSNAKTINLDIGEGLNKIGINRNQCDVVVFYHDITHGRIWDAKQVYEKRLINDGKPHEFTGPFFADDTDLREGMKSADVLRLQKYLTMKGWYDGKHDGIFQGRTKSATLNFQKFFGLKTDAVLGPKTKDFITNKSILNEEPDNNGDYQNFVPGSRITYAVRGFPRYLDESQLLKEIDRAFDQWEPHTGLTFDRVPNNQNADISILWEDLTEDNMLEGNGRGGLLAKSDKKMVLFDDSDTWILQNFDHVPYLGGFFVYNVMLHHVGKVIGLSNSGNQDDVMFPYYDSKKKTLSEGDVVAAKTLYLTPGIFGKQRTHPRQVGIKRIQSRGRQYQKNLVPYSGQFQPKVKARLDSIRRGGSLVEYSPEMERVYPQPVIPTIIESKQVDYAEVIPSNQGYEHVTQGYQPQKVAVQGIPSSQGYGLPQAHEVPVVLPPIYESPQVVYDQGIPSSQVVHGNVVQNYSNAMPEYAHGPEPLPLSIEDDYKITIPSQYNNISGSRDVFQL